MKQYLLLLTYRHRDGSTTTEWDIFCEKSVAKRIQETRIKELQNSGSKVEQSVVRMPI